MSPHRIQNPLILKLLYAIGKCTDRRLSWLNNIVALVYSSAVIPLLQLYLRCRGISANVISRHSVSSRTEFHFLFSDLDFTLVLPPQLQKEAIRYTKQLSKIFPFLGELEVYDEETYRRKVALEEGLSINLIHIRNTRKLAWLENSLSSSTTEYHAYKRIRAAKITAGRLGIQYQEGQYLLSKAYEALSAKLLSCAVVEIENKLEPGRCYLNHYLGRSLSVTREPHAIQVTSEVCAKLILALPIRFTGNEAMDRELSLLRRKYDLVETVGNLAELELIVFTGYLSGKQSVEAHELGWKQELEGVLAELRDGK